MSKNKVEIKKFFGTDVRVVNKDWLVVKDMFGALGRLDDNNQVITTDRKKLKTIIGEDVFCKWSIPSKTSKNKSRNSIDIECVQLSAVDNINLDIYFNKKYIIPSSVRENKFRYVLEEILKEFGFDIITQYKVDDYRVDFYIKDLNVVIEYDEEHHYNKNNIKNDLDRQRYIISKLGCKFIRCSYIFSDIKNAMRVVDEAIFTPLINDYVKLEDMYVKLKSHK